MAQIKRCNWAENHDLMQEYHDTEYGFPVRDNDTIFERLMLEIYQAGLNWRMILEKRKAFNKAFHDYNLEKVAKMSEQDIEKLAENPDIVRNRMKLNATVNNANVIIEQIKKHGSALNYFSRLPHRYNHIDELKDTVKIMKKDGFKFVGPLILEEFFLSIGLNKVNHQKHCFLFDNGSV